MTRNRSGSHIEFAGSVEGSSHHLKHGAQQERCVVVVVVVDVVADVGRDRDSGYGSSRVLWSWWSVVAVTAVMMVVVVVMAVA